MRSIRRVEFSLAVAAALLALAHGADAETAFPAASWEETDAGSHGGTAIARAAAHDDGTFSLEASAGNAPFVNGEPALARAVSRHDGAATLLAPGRYRGIVAVADLHGSTEATGAAHGGATLNASVSCADCVITGLSAPALLSTTPLVAPSEVAGETATASVTFTVSSNQWVTVQAFTGSAASGGPIVRVGVGGGAASTSLTGRVTEVTILPA